LPFFICGTIPGDNQNNPICTVLCGLCHTACACRNNLKLDFNAA
jgi:hypothetical protein